MKHRTTIQQNIRRVCGDMLYDEQVHTLYLLNSEQRNAKLREIRALRRKAKLEKRKLTAVDLEQVVPL